MGISSFVSPETNKSLTWKRNNQRREETRMTIDQSKVRGWLDEDIEDENNLHESFHQLISSLRSYQTSFDAYHLAPRIAFPRHGKGGFDRHIAVHGELGDEYQFCSTCVVRCWFEWTRPDVKLQRAAHRRVHCSLDLRWRFDQSEGIPSDLYSPLFHPMGEKALRWNICPCLVENAGSALTIIPSDRNGDNLVLYRAVVDVFINKADGGKHPFHLHSHTFWILSTSATIPKRNL